MKINQLYLTTYKTASHKNNSTQQSTKDTINIPVRLSNSFTNIRSYNTINFKGLYDPKDEELTKINIALSSKQDRTLGQNYFVEPEIQKSLLEYLNTGNISKEDINRLDRQKTRISNFQNMVSGDNQIVKDCKQSTNRYLKELNDSIKVIEETLKKLNINDKEIELFKLFVVKTSPIMYYMGFPDEVNHPSQVARRNVIEAHKWGSPNKEILKAAFVGWLHDPKFNSKICWGNMATHPTIAGAISEHVLNEPDMSAKIASYLNNDPDLIKDFKFGIKEALFINNDSEFVLRYSMLYSPPFPVVEPNKGLVEEIEDGEKLKEIAYQRYYAPAKDEKPLPFPENIKVQLENKNVDTGIRLIDKEKFSQVCSKLSGVHKELNNPVKVFNDILNGNIKNPKLLDDITKELKEENAVIRTYTKALPMFCHHDEVTKAGKIPASLIISDPMFLSLHKVAGSVVQPGPIKSFRESFSWNINNLPVYAQKSGKGWEKEALESCLQAADELNGRPVKNFKRKSMKKIEKLFLKKSTWGEYACFLDNYDITKADKFCKVLKKYYEIMAEHSKNMFKII